MERSFGVYGIGNALIDLQYQVPETIIKDLRLEKGGMKLVGSVEQKQLMRHLSESLPGIDPHQASGGSAANTMIALAQLGGQGAYGCLVGDDSYGQFYLEEMEVLGIKLHNPPLANAPSGTCVVLITPDAERTMNTDLGASANFSADHINEELISKSSWLYVEGYLFSSEGGQAAVRRAVRCAKQHGVKIALTFSDGFIVDVFRKPLEECVAQSDLAFANLNEARRFTGEEDEDKAFAKLCEAVPNAVMTLSERGARVKYDGKIEFIAPFPVKAIDDTGAGDMFAGGFLYGITEQRSAKDAGRLACFLASRVVSQLGPRLRTDVQELVADLPLYL